jgi:hypothetical protein
MYWWTMLVVYFGDGKCYALLLCFCDCNVTYVFWCVISFLCAMCSCSDCFEEVKLRPTISRFGAHDQIFVFCLKIAGSLLWGVLSDERMDL